jgi:long-chain fatty acid transport protein
MAPRLNRGHNPVFILGAAALSFSNLQGAGYAIAEQSISGLGQGFAGAAAVAEDASTVWHNPAGMSILGGEPQLAGGIHFILPSAKFRNTGTVTLNPIAPSGPTFVPTQGPDDTSDSAALVPNLAYVHPLNEQLALGFAVNVPFGLRTSYREGWVGRYVAIETDLKTISFNPSISYRVNERLVMGGGFSYVTAEAILSNAIDFGLVALSTAAQNPAFGAALAPLIPDLGATRGARNYDGSIRLEGDDDGFSANFGILFTPQEGTRIGVHYRSAVDLKLKGKADFTVPAALDPLLGSLFSDQGGSVDLTLPANLSVSLYQEINPRLALLADITWTDWSVFDELFVRYDGSLAGSSVERPIPEEWDDTFRYSVGARYILNEQIALRAGFVLDEAAVQSPEFRSPRIPDAERMWLTFGFHWEMGSGLALDLSYAHIFVDDSKTNNDKHTSGQLLLGDSTASVNILSLGGTYRF